jgi:hypothetical protein
VILHPGFLPRKIRTNRLNQYLTIGPYFNVVMMGSVLLLTMNVFIYKIVMFIAIISLINTASYKIELSRNQAYIHTEMVFWAHERFLQDEVDRVYYKIFRGRNYVRWDLMIDLKDGTELHPEIPMYDNKIQAYIESQ